MAPHVEANSLSDITQLAGNPPKYPRNPTEAKRPPLTLYIARVPGSRDIILTPLKPQPKNVTAEDVAASLYYLHLDTEEDARFQEEIQTSPVAGDGEATVQKPLPRKPLPESARSSLELSRQVTANLKGSEPSSIVPKRKPIPSDQQKPVSADQAIPIQKEIVRRPLGPRPLPAEPEMQLSRLPGIENSPLSDAPNPNMRASPPKLSSEITRDTHAAGFASAGAEGSVASNAFSITVIRRDPSSGAQWNVGKVWGHPVYDEAQIRRGKPTSRNKKPYFDMSVHLTTPGYNYFRNTRTPSQLEVGATRVNPGVTKPQTNPASTTGFDRQVRMEGSSFWGRPSQHKRSRSEISEKETSTRGRSLSGNSMAELSLNSEDAIPETSSLTKGYTFLSPWGGRCKFVTGGGGRSLRCKHFLPAPISASNGADFSSSSQAPSVASELRFNLPTSALFTPSASNKKIGPDLKHFSISKIGHIRNKLSPDKIRPPLPPRPHPTSYAALYPSDEEAPPLPPRPSSNIFRRVSSDVESPGRPSATTLPNAEYEDGYSDDEARLDLSIGQEKAGGGNRGKRVKLGKLIIHDEGFKMLDLIVAANMGIWWSVWEFGKV